MVKARILQSVMEQIKKYGFRGFTLEDVASDLGISKKTIYKYFEGKDDIIREVVVSQIETNKMKIFESVRTQETWLDKMTLLANCEWDQNLKLVIEMKKYYPDLWKELKLMHDSLYEQRRELLRQAMASGDIRSDINLDLLVIIVRASMEALFHAEFSDNYLRQVIKEFGKIIMCGILSPESKLRGAFLNER